MVKELVTAAGIPGRGSRFAKPPEGTYAVWFDEVETDGPDGTAPMIYRHTVTVELYTPFPDPDSEAALEQQMGLRNIHWVKHPRYWIQSEQLYQIIYEFDYTEKRRI